MRPVPIGIVIALCLTACVCTPTDKSAPGDVPKEARDSAAGNSSSDVTLSRLDNQTGYGVAGPEGFAGTLTYEGQHWSLDASFEFPTAGYTVKDLDVTVLKRLPEEVHITIPYQPPPTDALVAQVLTKEPVTWSGAVSKDATFKIQVERIPPGTAADAGL